MSESLQQPETKHFYEFEAFRLDPQEKILTTGGEAIALAPKVFDTLEVFICNAGRLIEKEELMQRIWQDRFVEEGNLAFNVKELRKALGDSASEPRFIETVPRRGYRFIAEVKKISTADFSARENSEELSFHKIITEPNAEAASDGDSQGEKPAIKTSPLSNAFASVASRPVIYSIAAILISIVLLSGFFMLRGRDSFLERFGSANRNSGFLTVEKLTDTGNADGANISPDGNFLAYYTVEGKKETIWLRQFATGKSIPILVSTDENFSGVSFSRDGEYIYYFNTRKGEPPQLSRISILGGVPTLVLTNVHIAYSFSPDGSQIAFTRIDDAGSELMIADADGKNERKIFTSPKPRYLFSVAWSPDGASIAYCAGNGKFAGGAMDYSIVERNLADGTEKSLTDFKWNYIESVKWLPDQSGLLVTARERAEDTNQIWRLSLPDGRAERITGDSSSLSLRGATADFSRIVASRDFLNSSIWIAPTDNLSGVQPIAKAQSNLAWTADDKIVFPARDTVKTDIWLMNADGGDKRQLTADDSLERSPATSPEGRFIVFVSDRAGQQNIWRADADGGNPTQLTFGDGEINPTFTPDGQMVVFNAVKNGSLWRVSVSGGEAAQLSAEKSLRVAVSPDGTKFAHFGRRDNKRKLFVKSFPECQPLNEFEIASGEATPGKVVWAQDGKSLIYDNNDLPEVDNLWRQSLDGGEPQKLTNFTSERIFDFSFSPDGKWLALVRGLWNSDAVLLKGFK
ncbi:MAG: winged helix-turn-helix domain-containing protein [Pyrinomonadaceae bacterium]